MTCGECLHFEPRGSAAASDGLEPFGADGLCRERSARLGLPGACMVDLDDRACGYWERPTDETTTPSTAAGAVRPTRSGVDGTSQAGRPGAGHPTHNRRTT